VSAIRTLNDLQDAMSHEFAWRKKELHALKGLVVANEKKPSQDLYIRAAVPLLYAHWEGFVKQIAKMYLEFVGRQKLRHDQLSRHFLAMAVGRLVRGTAASSKIEPCLTVVAFFESQLPTRSQLEWKHGVNAKSNLNADVFREIVLTLGLDYSRFETKEKILDEKLLNNRNRIAHGQYSMVGYEEYVALHDEMLALMQDFYNQIDNDANLGRYLSNPPQAQGAVG
jgi:hypothetical protein